MAFFNSLSLYSRLLCIFYCQSSRWELCGNVRGCMRIYSLFQLVFLHFNKWRPDGAADSNLNHPGFYRKQYLTNNIPVRLFMRGTSSVCEYLHLLVCCIEYLSHLLYFVTNRIKVYSSERCKFLSTETKDCLRYSGKFLSDVSSIEVM